MAVAGSLLRRILFWAHLSSGVAASAIILVLSVTGVLLTYEKQVVAAAARANQVVPGSTPLSADELAAAARKAAPLTRRPSLVFVPDPASPVSVARGREAPLLLDPYTGATLEDASAGTRAVMRTIENWHRWLGGTSSSTRATSVDVANLLFLFMIASGIYLWLPAVWRWRTVRGLLLFQRRYVNSRFRDYSWHHVFSFWALIPLFLIALSGVVMSFGWANDLLYSAYGETAAPRAEETRARSGAAPASPARLQALLDSAKAHAGNWQRLTLPITSNGDRIEVLVELQSDAWRPPRQTLVLSTVDASVLDARMQVQTPGQAARTWMRFVHTGERYGVLGQTIAGLASLAACFLVYTGVALAWRRLISR